MSTITTNLRASAITRTSALRAADGVIAGYIHTLAREAATPAAQETSEPVLSRLVKQAYDCGYGRSSGASRGSGSASRRRPAMRRVPSPA